jgi:hypothetical protein
MFARFRQRQNRLFVSLVEARRADGKVRQEHIASLGSIDIEQSLAERLAFWAAPARAPRQTVEPGRRCEPSQIVRRRACPHPDAHARRDTGFRSIGTQDVYSGGYRIPSGSLMLGAIRTTLDKF